MNNITAGDIVVQINHGFPGNLTILGGHICHPDFPEDEIPTHICPTIPIDENFIRVVLDKFAEGGETREWVKSHLKGKPYVGGVGDVQMMEDGIEGGSIETSGYLTASNIFILERVVPHTPMGLKALSVWAAFYFKHQVGYDYSIYPEHAEQIGLGWVLNQLFGLPIEVSPWLGETTDIEGFKDESYWVQDCDELAKRLTNWEAIADRIEKPWKRNVNAGQPIDWLLNPAYRVKKDSPLQLK